MTLIHLGAALQRHGCERYGDRVTRSAPSSVDAQLLEFIRTRLLSAGTVIVAITSLGVPVPEWRRTARAAARELGRPVRTLVHGDVVQAYLTDWPASSQERVVHDRAMRAAVGAARSLS
jgi:hypothetical protein